jgi:hypothetical protein
MGTTSSATINVALDAAMVAPGTATTGKVYLSVNNEKVDAESLMLRIVGGEYTLIKHATGSGDERRVHNYYSSSIFLDYAFPLTVVQDGCFRKGQYEFPFSFTLPPGVLPTMGAATQSGQNSGHCSVKYSMEVKLHRRGWMTWDVKNSRELTVLGTPVQHIPKFGTYLPPSEYPLHFCCCYKVGNVRLGLSTETSLLAAGETFDVSYVVQNNSTSRIKALELEVVEVVTWRSRMFTATKSSQLFHKRLEQGDIQFDLSAINPNDSATVGGNGTISNPDILKELKEILDSRRHCCPVNLPPSARPTMDGSLIDVEHFLKVRIATPFGTSDPEILSRLTVHRYGIQAAPVIETDGSIYTPMAMSLPAGWNATVAQPVTVPTPPYAVATAYETEDVKGPSDFTPSAPDFNYNGTANLFQILTKTYDQPGEFKKWCEWCNENQADILTAPDYATLFKTLRKTFDQIAVAEQLAISSSGISCAHIASALSTCLAAVKTDVAKKLSTKCNDKQNKTTVKDKLSQFEWMCVEASYN